MCVCVCVCVCVCKGLSCEMSSGNLRWVCGDVPSRNLEMLHVAVTCSYFYSHHCVQSAVSHELPLRVGLIHVP